MLVPGALNDTKQIRKAGAVIFADFGAETTYYYFFKSILKNGPWNHAQDLDLAICYTEKKK